MVAPNSSRKVVWQCDVDRSHVWEALVRHHVAAKVGCPWCGGRELTLDNTLLACFPAVAAEWHPTKNGTLIPAGISRGNGRKVWWQCSKDPAHVWRTSVTNRTGGGRGCPMCAGHVATKTTSLRAKCPKVAQEWHPTKNGALGPGDVTPGSSRKVWWQCHKDALHVWQAVIANRTGEGSGCPACSGLVATWRTSLLVLFPRIAKEWHPTKNGRLVPADVRPGSPRIAWWRCRRDPSHEWKARVTDRAGPKKRGCPMCSGRVATPATSLAAKIPEIAKQWHPTKNRGLGPGDVKPYSNRKVWWQCPRDATHAWRAVVGSRAGRRTGCPICSNKVATPATSLAARFPDLAAEWHPTRNGRLRPERVVAGGTRKVWWQCRADPSHAWRAQIGDRSRLGRGCPACRTLLAKQPELAREWHPTKNGSLTPATVTAGSNRRAWWRCKLNRAHEWRMSVGDRSRGAGCPDCIRAGTARRALRGMERVAPSRALPLAPKG
jgi:hypothetical protein